MIDNLDGWRKQIDGIDEKIITQLAKRVEVVRKIGKFKKERNISVFDKYRWKDVLNSNIKKGEKVGLSKGFVKNLFELIHKYSQLVQKKS